MILAGSSGDHRLLGRYYGASWMPSHAHADTVFAFSTTCCHSVLGFSASGVGIVILAICIADWVRYARPCVRVSWSEGGGVHHGCQAPAPTTSISCSFICSQRTAAIFVIMAVTWPPSSCWKRP